MKDTYFHRVSAHSPTKFWINNVTKEEAELALGAGALGCTQNPSYPWKMISHPTEKNYVLDYLDQIIKEESDDNEVQIKLQQKLVMKVGEYFLPLYEHSGGRHGYVSIQGDPFKEDTETILKCARFNREAGVNIMAKIPATEDGLKAIEILLREGIPINATEVFAVRQALDVCEIYDRVTRGVKNPPIIYYSHITGIYDEYLTNYVEKNKVDISPDVLWQGGLAVARKVYQITKDRYPEVGYIGGGARGLQHFTEMVGGDVCITINWKGAADKLIEKDPPVVYRFFNPVPEKVIDELSEKLDDFRKGYFINAIEPHEYENFGPVDLFRNSFETAWKKAEEFIKDRRKAIL
jgi:transaldolase